jgi:hypothetical protein
VADHKLLDPPARDTAKDDVASQSELLKEILAQADEADKIEVKVSLGSLSREERRHRLYGA